MARPAAYVLLSAGAKGCGPEGHSRSCRTQDYLHVSSVRSHGSDELADCAGCAESFGRLKITKPSIEPFAAGSDRVGQTGEKSVSRYRSKWTYRTYVGE